MKPIIDISFYQAPTSDLKMKGVYVIENIINGNRYVGSSNNLQKRWNGHKSALQRGKHHSQYLQNSWNKYGEKNFTFTPLIWCDEENLFLYEQMCIEALHPEYNIAVCAEASMRGVKFTEEHKAKIGATNAILRKGKHPSAETRAKMSASQIGRKWSEETRAKLSMYKGENHPLYGRCLTDEHKANVSASLTGRVMSEDTRKKLSAALLGNTNSTGRVLTDIHKQRIINSNTGKKRSEESKRNIGLSKFGNTYRRGTKASDETKEKLRLSHLGKTLSEETRAKMSASQKLRWQNRKLMNSIANSEEC